MIDPTSPVTVVLLCFNHERYLETAIRSVAQQTLKPSRVVLFDDCSSDNSVPAIRSVLGGVKPEDSNAITFVEHDVNKGLTHTLNEALAHVHTEFVCFLATDDWMECDRLRLQVESFRSSHDGVAVSYSDMFVRDDDGDLIAESYLGTRPPPENDLFLSSVARCAIPAPSAMIRTSALVAVGPYDERLPMEDFDMWLRLLRRYDATFVDAPLVNYRKATHSMTNVTAVWEFRKWMLPSLRKHVDVEGVRGDRVLDRIEELAWELYLRGRSAEETADDFRMVSARRGRLHKRFRSLPVRLHVRGPAVRRCIRIGTDPIGHIQLKLRSRRQTGATSTATTGRVDGPPA